MEYLSDLEIRYGRVKLLDGTELQLCNLKQCKPERQEELKKCELVKAFGVASKNGGVYHAIVMEGYVEYDRGNKVFYFAGGNAYNPGCSKILNSRWGVRLIYPSAKITCTRCLKKIKEYGVI